MCTRRASNAIPAAWQAAVTAYPGSGSAVRRPTLPSLPQCVRSRWLRGSAVAQAIPPLVATPIFYVNGEPHIGHYYTAVIADATQRWLRVKGADGVVFATGTDEHGLKVQESAALAGIAPAAFCNLNSNKFRSLFDAAGIEYTDFIRTTEPRHHEVVDTLWTTLVANGQIYKGTYEGWYCISDEAYLADSQVVEKVGGDGSITMVSVESGNAVVRMREDNYMFRLSEYTDRLRAWLDSGTNVVQPPNRAAEVRQFLDDGLPDLSVSRLAKSLSWGIPVPGDPDHTVYVWLDALANYLTVGGYPNVKNPVDTHIIGKDILKFHAIYWPAFLLGAGLPLPRQIIAHGHWTVEKSKMSKSKGNVVNPAEMLEKYGNDQFRYFMLSEGRNHLDSDFSEARVAVVINELANNLGNLLSRCTAKKVNLDRQVPLRAEVEGHFDEVDKDLIANVSGLRERVTEHYDGAQFGRGISAISEVLGHANRYIDQNQPWVLAKTPDDPVARLQLRKTLYVSLEVLRIAGILLQPVCPAVATDLLNHVAGGTGAGERTVRGTEFGALDGEALAIRKKPLIPRCAVVAG